MTPDRFSGDPRLILGVNGWTIDYEGGQPVMDAGLENFVIISLFTRPGWCGNAYLSPVEQIGSDFLDTCGQALTLQTLADIENAALRALKSDLLPNVSVSVVNPNGWDLQITINLGNGASPMILKRNNALWSNQANNPASGRLVKVA